MNFIVYSSSAGSGKTFTLVKEYLKIVLNDPQVYRNVLAVTFTNKSANEMKQRVLKYLTDLSSPGNEDPENARKTLLPDLMEDLNFDEQSITERARQVLALILHHYSDFNVSTIDSFTYRIMRTFAYDLQLPVDFDVELDQKKLLSKAVDLVISKAGVEDQLTDLLVRFTEYKAEMENNWQIKGDLVEFAENLIREEGFENLEQLKQINTEGFFQLRSKLYAIKMQFEHFLSRQAEEIFDRIVEHNISHEAFHRYNSGLIKYLKRFVENDFTMLEPNLHVDEIVVEGKWVSKHASPVEQSAIMEIQAWILGKYNKIISYIARNKEAYHFARVIYQHIYQLALLTEIEKVIGEIRSQTKAVHISEFNKRISRIVLNEPVPFIYERVGERFRHYLIDEFQDTSVLQWQNLLPLIDNSLASNRFNLLVGDVKQAIYRWRNGDVEQFLRLSRLNKQSDPKLLPERERILINHIDHRNLETNYRSGNEIVEFNNGFFQTISTLLPAEFKDIYSGLVQKNNPLKRGGYVNIEFFDPKDRKENMLSRNASRVLEIIRELQNENFELKDIAVLCRRNRDASALAGFLLSQEVAVISSESLLVKNSPEVKFLSNIVNYLLRPTPILELSILRYLLVSGKRPNDVFFGYLERDRSSASEDPRRFVDLINDFGIGFSPSWLLRLPLYEMMEELVRLFELNQSPGSFLQFFLDAVLEFSSKNGNDLSEFAEWWEEKKENWSVIVPEGMNAVQIMTIHKAKGLQFPVVIYPFATERLRITKKFVWVDVEHPDFPELRTALIKNTKSLEGTVYQKVYDSEYNKTLLDLMNLLYVVMTRPENRLYILTELKGSTEGKASSVPAMFHHYLVSRGIWDAALNKYEFGVKTPKEIKKKTEEKKKKEAEISQTMLGRMISIAWLKRAVLSLRALERWDVDAPDRNVKWGNIVHTVMAGIRNASDLDRVLEEQEGRGVISDSERVDLKKLISELIAKPELKPFFVEGANVKNETEIIHPSGFSYRPDRVIISGKNAIVIDYKTGTPDEKHTAQILRYGRLLSEMGYENIEHYLLYLDQDVCVVKVA